MTFTIQLSKQAEKEDLPFIDPAMASRILAAVRNKLMVDPVRFGKPLRFSLKGYRSLRVGDYRILYDIEPKMQIVRIITIGHRRDIYEQ